MRTYLLAVACLLLSFVSYAQFPPTGGPAPGNQANVPIDGGASILLASGVAYGLRRLKQRRRA